MLQFGWKERGGPPLHQFEKKGFGSILIFSLIEHDLRGKGTFHAESDGLRFDATFALRDVEVQQRDTLGRPDGMLA